MHEHPSNLGEYADSWEAVRSAFSLDPEYVHLGTSQFLASHPRPVREVIERHRAALDRNPVLYAEEQEDRLMNRVREAVARYLGAGDPMEIALTDSTTMGLGLVYSALPLQPGDEIVTTDHEHFSHFEALRGICERAGVVVRRVKLYDGSAADSEPRALVDRIMGAVGPRTRGIAVTWVHSDTGLKLPIAALAGALKRAADACDATRPWLSVDGTHGVGIETDTVGTLGCEFLVADSHKWLYGPRGTGFVWAPVARWRRMRRVIPSFTEAMDAFSEGESTDLPMDGRQFTPGGFHSLEHRWAASVAFAFHEAIGKDRVAGRVRELTTRCKEGLRDMPGVRLHTPMEPERSSGIVAFEIEGMESKEARQRLLERRIIATVAPYPTAYLRLTPGIINTPDEVDRALDAVRALGR